MPENTFDDLDFGVDESVPTQAQQTATAPPVEVSSMFDYEFNQGKFYCFKTGDIYQFLTSNGAYHVMERIKNGVIMELEYVGITDCSSFKNDESRKEENEIELKLLEIQKEINEYPNLDTIPKDSEMYADVKKLWDDFYVWKKKKIMFTKNSSTDNSNSNIMKEVAKARQFTKDTLAKAREEKWDEDELNAVLYPDSEQYEKFTPRADKKTRHKILANLE